MPTLSVFVITSGARLQSLPMNFYGMRRRKNRTPFRKVKRQSRRFFSLPRFDKEPRPRVQFAASTGRFTEAPQRRITLTL